MIRTSIPFIALLGILVVAGCDSSSRDSSAAHTSGRHPLLQPLAWMHGTWTMQDSSAILIESWHPVDDTTLAGAAGEIRSGDTTLFEFLELKVRNDTLSYVATVTGQNQGRPIPFVFAGESGGEFVFENPDHDFPQRIVYSHPSADKMHARIEGNIGGKMKSREFSYTRDQDAAPDRIESKRASDSARAKGR